MQRKLTAILSADVVGYSALMEADEAGTLERLKANRSAIFDLHVANHGGRVFKLMGDGALVEFPSVIAAVDCALAIQDATAQSEREISEAKRIRYRIGVNLGDIIIDGDDIYGEGVNIAARLQTLAPAGGVALSATVRDHVEGKAHCVFEDMGEYTVKNIERPVHVFSVRSGGADRKADRRRRASICVLPFVNMSGDADQEYFSDGITEDIITDLSKVSTLVVVSRNSAFMFKGKNVDVPKVARELKVNHVLEGSVRKAGGRVRITAQLIDGATNGHVWAERYDRDLNDIFALQDEISEAIVAALKLKLLPEEQKVIKQRGTNNLAAYEFFLRGTRPAFSHDELRDCTALLEVATKLAPDYADAWGALAITRARWRLYRPFAERDEIAATVSDEIERALALEPHSIGAWTAKFQLIPPFGQFVAADALANRIEEFASRKPNWLFFYIVHLQCLGRMRDAIEIAQRVYDIDPSNPFFANLHGLSLLYGGRYEEARESLENTVARWPEYSAATLSLISVCVHTEDWAAVDSLMAAERLAKFPLERFEHIARGLIRLKQDPALARLHLVETARSRFESSGHAEFSLLQWAAQAGAVDEAYAIADKAKFGPAGDSQDSMGFEAFRTNYLFNSTFTAFRHDARFVKLCARLGLVDYWLKTLHWPDCIGEVAPYYDFKAECEKIAAGPPLPPAHEKWCSPT